MTFKQKKLRKQNKAIFATLNENVELFPLEKKYQRKRKKNWEK